MAITTISTPAAYTPAFNPQWWKASSTQTAQPNFRYRIVLTDVISGGTVTIDQDADPSGFLDLDTGAFAEQYITQPNPSGAYGFQLNTGAIRQIRVNIGEVYGATPTYYAGTNQTYFVWNGALDWLTFQSYSLNDYVYDRGSSRLRFLTNNEASGYTYGSVAATSAYMNQDETMTTHSNYIYCLSAAPGTYNQFENIRVIGYDSSGNQLSSTDIANPYALSGSTYTNRYVYIDVGYKGLLNMPAGQVVAGTYPIPVSTFAYYDIRDFNNGVGAGASTCLIKRVYVNCEPRFDKIAMHYLSVEGEYETQMFPKLSIRRHDVTRTTYSKMPYTYGAYNYGDAVRKTLTATVQQRITINTDWLTEIQSTRLKDAVSSPVLYLDFNDGAGFVAMQMVTNSYEQKKKYNSSMISVSFDLEYAHSNVRQKQ